ncbi:MAG: histidinol dehydrogenase [Prevotellaceae bacterium]|nr:histidinol dehydrogenase [Prevotellaceae bacterium]
MRIIENPTRRSWPLLAMRNELDNESLSQTVATIIERVIKDGDEALFQLSKEIDNLESFVLQVSKDDIDASAEKISPQLKLAIDTAAGNIRRFHEAQLSTDVDIETSPGVRCLQKSIPIQRVGLYIPGGTAPLFSTVLMLAIPAQVVGCPEIVLCTPPSSSGAVASEILYAASRCGLSRVFAVGGAQAIAAMAYGTTTIPRVDKIFGPGNRYVTRAKQMVAMRQTAIDMPAGPSEVMIMADDSAEAAFVAADLLSQAEHGADSQAIVLTGSMDLALRIKDCLNEQMEHLPRRAFAAKSLSHSRIIILPEAKDMLDFANIYAPEHLIISMRNAWDVAAGLTSAGSVFIGNFSPESAGDYASGTNHTLPTTGWARAYSGVNTDSFVRKITYQELSPQGLNSLSETIITMAEAEGLDAHANAVKIRISTLKS